MKATPLVLVLVGLFTLSGCSDSGETASKASTALDRETGASESISAPIKSGFQTEVDRASAQIQCDTKKIVPASDGWGALFTCISGQAETSKFFINEDLGTGKVKSIKFLWNDWFRDAGYGFHADKADADRMLEGVLALYASEHSTELRSSFYSKKDRTFTTNTLTLEYTFDRGPSIDERMIVITPVNSR